MRRLARTLQMLSQGRTIPEIGVELGMRGEAVEAMISHLVYDKYLLNVQCEGCGLCARCCSSGAERRMFVLTPKGEDCMRSES